MSKKYIVIGGGGFIGSNLITMLVSHNEPVEVICIDRSVPAMQISGCKYVKINLALIDTLPSIIDSDSCVIHLAWNGVPNSQDNTPSIDLKQNLLTSISLFESCVKNNAKSIIFLSTGGGIYGKPDKVPIDEHHPTYPLSIYGIDKLAVENYLRLFTKGTTTKGVVLRVSNPYGRFQKPFTGQGVIATFLASALLDYPVTVWGDGTEIRDYIYIDDLTNVIYKACETEKDFTLANIGSGVGTSLNEIINLIQEVSKKKLKIVYMSKTTAEMGKNILDCSYAERIFNWKARTTLANGILKMYSLWNTNTRQFDLIKGE